MSKKSDKLREEIAQTKAHLSQNLEKLEAQVRQDVGSAKESLEGAIHNVKSAVSFFSLEEQIQKRPLLMAGASMLSGVVFTRWLVGGGGYSRAPLAEGRRSGPATPRVVRAIAEQYPDEVRILKNMAFSFLVNLAAEKAKETLPHLVDTIGDLEKHLKKEMAKRRG